MEFKVSKREFAKQVSQAIRGIPIRTDNSILKNLLIEAKENKLVIQSTNNILTVQAELQTTILREGKVCVDAKLLDGLLKKIKLKAKQDIELTISVNNDELIVESNSSKTNLKIADETLYPEIQLIKGTTFFETSVEDFVQSINQTAFSTVKNESRPILAGILLKLQGNYATFVSTDGYRMSLKVVNIENAEGEKEVVAPVDSYIDAGKIATSQKKGKVKVYLSEEQILFEMNNVLVQTSLMKGEFLNYQNVFNMTFTTKVIMDRLILLETLERASIFIPKDKITLVALIADNDLVNIEIDTESGNVKEVIEANMTGEKISISFNIAYLITALKSISGDRVAFHFISSNQPVIIEALGNKSYRHMLLPVRTN